MLYAEQILHILDRCEKVVGEPLLSVRKQLRRANEWLPMVWELLVLDAAAQIASVEYEPPTCGTSHPDFLLNFYDGSKVWIEATFRQEKVEGSVEYDVEHPAYRKLKHKEDQARKANIEDAFIVCIGTDRVSHLGNFRGPREIGPEQAAISFLENADCVSAALIAPSFARFRVFEGQIRETQPILVEHPESKSQLTDGLKAHLVKMDFNRWLLSPNASPVESPVRDLLPRKKGGPLSLPLIDERLLPKPPVEESGLVYTYHWKFDHLRIVPWGERMELLVNNKHVLFADTPEECALYASELYHVSSYYIYGPNGIELAPDPGVPSDLSEWIFEVPN